MSEGSLQVHFQAILYGTRLPFRYVVELQAEGIRTGLTAVVWGRRRARRTMQMFIDDGAQLLEEHGLISHLAAEIFAQRREEAMTKVKVGDSIKLLVDIGPYNKGRVCRVMQVAQPSTYLPRGDNAWDDDKYPIAVLPVRAATDSVTLGPTDWLHLQRGEFGPLDMEVDD